MTAIRLLFLTIISRVASCDGLLLPKESNENLIPADLLLDSLTLVGDHVKGIDDLKRVERAEKSDRVEIVPNTPLDGDHVRGMDDLKRVERSLNNSTSNKSSSSSNQSNKSSENQSNSNKKNESNSGKGGSNSGSSSSNQSSESDNKNKAKSQDKSSRDNSGDNSSKKSKGGGGGSKDDGNDEEKLIKSKLHDLLMLPSRIKEAFHRVFKLFSKDDDDGGNNDGSIDLLKIPHFLNKLKGLFDA